MVVRDDVREYRAHTHNLHTSSHIATGGRSFVVVRVRSALLARQPHHALRRNDDDDDADGSRQRAHNTIHSSYGVNECDARTGV